ncbi:hypothetical protein JNJ66_06730 [Candidatus Saccharibacteria bacterium]|nr:hypothetical protein [Candidatus Saccharibacteria bacterium]
MKTPELHSRHASPHEALTIGANSLHLTRRQEHFAQRHAEMADLAEHLWEHGDRRLGGVAVDQALREAGEPEPYVGRHRLENATLNQVEGMESMYDQAAKKSAEQLEHVMKTEREKLADLDDTRRSRLEGNLHPDRVKLPRKLRREQRRSKTSMAEWLATEASPEAFLTVVAASIEAARSYTKSREFKKFGKKERKRFDRGLKEAVKRGTLHPDLLAAADATADQVRLHSASALDELHLKGNRGYALRPSNTNVLTREAGKGTVAHERLHLIGSLYAHMIDEPVTEKLNGLIRETEPDSYPVEIEMLDDICTMADIDDYELSQLYAHKTGDTPYESGAANLEAFKARVKKSVGWDVVGWAIKYKDHYEERLGETGARAAAAMAVRTAKMMRDGATETEIDDACNKLDIDNKVPELSRRIIQMDIIDSMRQPSITDTAESEDHARAA